MTQLIWNEVGDRIFETGVDRGVLYTSDGTGIVWNGLTAVTESPSGGESTPYYIDGVKYLNVSGRKEFSGTIEAWTYPDEFAEYDGWAVLDNGISVDEQRRKPFNLSYRTRLGNDISGQDYGYKIHLVYNALANPTESAYSTVGEEVEPMTFSWAFSTLPAKAISTTPLAPMSHIVIDSTKTNPTQLRYIEDILYGTDTQVPRLLTLDEIFGLFENPIETFWIQADPVTGLSLLIASNTTDGDLKGRRNEGLYVAAR